MNRALALLAAVAALLLTSTALAACGGDSGDTGPTTINASEDISTPEIPMQPGAGETYPEKVKREYLKQCEEASGGKTSLCECNLKAFEETMPVEQYLAVTNPKPGKPTEPTPTETGRRLNACADDYEASGGG